MSMHVQPRQLSLAQMMVRSQQHHERRCGSAPESPAVAGDAVRPRLDGSEPLAFAATLRGPVVGRGGRH